jgi:rubrerythrin
MEELSVTAATIISFAERLEDASARYYEELAERFAAQKEKFLSFARESRKNKTLVVRTYQETISDALEACFSFEGLRLADYAVGELSAEGKSDTQALQAAIVLEEKAVRFYEDVAGRCGTLLATIPRAFKKVAETRRKRKQELQAMV